MKIIDQACANEQAFPTAADALAVRENGFIAATHEVERRIKREIKNAANVMGGVILKSRFKKVCLLFFCLVIFFSPMASYAQNLLWLQSGQKNYSQLIDYTICTEVPKYSYCAAQNIPTVGSIDSNDLNVVIRKPLLQNIINSLFHREDYQNIYNVIRTCQEYYALNICSGSFILEPREHFTKDGIYQEANARNIYMMVKMQDLIGECEKGEVFCSLDKVQISGNYAKVFITRSINTHAIDRNRDLGNYVETDVREGYLLEKVDGKWKIENIMFDNAPYLEGDAKRIFNDEKETVNLFRLFEDAEDVSVWINAFSFEKCQRKDYCPYGNYMSYIIGDIESPTFDVERFVYERDHPNTAFESWNAQSDFK